VKPAARVGDMHSCPLTADGIVHEGGGILTGVGSVLIERREAARAADTAMCSGATDLIASGSGTVLIRGLPAARVDEATVHGGRILPAGATTVLIGGPSVSPPGLAAIAKNVAEMDRLEDRLDERKRKRQELNDMLKFEHKSAWDRAWEALTPKPEGDQYAQKYADEIVQKAQREWAAEQRDEFDKAIARDNQRIDELRRENDARREGKPVTPSAPNPDLDKPLFGE
jgi:uncharacterized Zn-binding protein involved in type VI secretion